MRRPRTRTGSRAFRCAAGSARTSNSKAPRGDADANTSEFTLKTQFIEATKAAKWREAVETFVRLRTAHPGVLADKRLRYLHAKALYEAKEVATSATELEALLGAPTVEEVVHRDDLVVL